MTELFIIVLVAVYALGYWHARNDAREDQRFKANVDYFAKLATGVERQEERNAQAPGERSPGDGVRRQGHVD